MSLFSTQISPKALAPLCRQLATAYAAGIPILRSLDLASENTNDKVVRDVLGDMRNRIEHGATLADAARAHGNRLPVLFVELLAGGETGGKLDTTLRDLANFYEDRLAMQRMVVRKGAYPAFQLVIAWFLGTFALGLIRNLSFTHRFDLGRYFIKYVFLQMMAMAVCAGIIAALAAMGKLGVLRTIWGWIATRVWPISPVTLRFAQARFFRSLALLIGSGLPMVRAIERSAAAAANPYVEQDFLKTLPLVREGCTLVDAFAGCQYMSSTARQMMRVGEESGDLEDALQKTAQYQMDEAVHALNVAARVGEVLVTLFVASVVGYVVISFYSTYYGKMLDGLKF